MFRKSNKPILKTEEEIELLRASCQLVSRTFAELKQHIKPGVSTLQLDRIAEEFIRDHGAVPAFKNYQPSPDDIPFPGTLCTSRNEEVVHGVPSETEVLQDGDIISLDCGVILNEYFGDSAYTFPVGEVDEETQRLLDVTKACLELGVEQARRGNRIGDISFAVQRHAEQNGFGVVRELVGHGIGRSLHEPPEVPNFGRRGNGPKIETGLVIAIEPMINAGRAGVVRKKDGWTIATADNKRSAHFEHTIAVQADGPERLTTFEWIETADYAGEVSR